MSRKMLRRACFVIAVFGALAACEKSAPPVPSSPAAPAPAAPAPASATATTTPVATAPAVKLEAVAAREDFEEEAATQITPANLEKQLEALEQELAAE